MYGLDLTDFYMTGVHAEITVPILTLFPGPQGYRRDRSPPLDG